MFNSIHRAAALQKGLTATAKPVKTPVADVEMKKAPAGAIVCDICGRPGHTAPLCPMNSSMVRMLFVSVIIL